MRNWYVGGISLHFNKINLSFTEYRIIFWNMNVDTLRILFVGRWFTVKSLCLCQRYVVVQKLSKIHGQMGQYFGIWVWAVCIAAVNKTTNVSRVWKHLTSHWSSRFWDAIAIISLCNACEFWSDWTKNWVFLVVTCSIDCAKCGIPITLYRVHFYGVDVDRFLENFSFACSFSFTSVGGMWNKNVIC